IHTHHLSYRFSQEITSVGLSDDSSPSTIFTRHVGARKKIHLQFNHTLALARLAPSALGIKGEPARAITAHAGHRNLCVKIANLIEDLDVGRRGRARGFPDGRLVDLVNRIDRFHASASLEQLPGAVPFSV